MTEPVRIRLLDAAHGIIESDGWNTVTMARIAEVAGVSRQTVYNEFGTKHGLAEQLAMRAARPVPDRRA
ncbi:TetR/AcrR family transcriptional regulator [Aeromicrobium sp. UC242_57]|uniref:TetR/AcrR family transcriptional regulator n=1 Tax=Aeromicrobium sp. UC242_57 TaxID=3374624 RepID=UPI003787B943